MEILDLLNKNASGVNLLVLVAYAIFTLGIWLETRRTALRTEKLAKQAQDAFKFQFAATFMQLIKPLPDSISGMKGKILDEVQWYKDLEVMFSKCFPEAWAELWEIVHKYSQEEKT